MEVISVIIPTLDRPQQIVKVLKNLKETSKFLTEAVVLIDEEDTESKERVIDYCGAGDSQYVIVRVMKGSPTAIEKWNHGAKHAEGSWIMLAADDIEFPMGWDLDSIETPNMGFLAFRDTAESRKPFEPHFMATREWLRKHNGGVLAIPEYYHWGPDVETAARAHKANHYVTSKAIIVHNHCLFGTAPDDSTYRKAAPHYESDLLKIKAREMMGFPDNFEAVIT